VLKANLLLSIFVVLLARVFAAQTTEAQLLFETPVGGGGGCDPFFQITYLMDEVSKHSGSTGLVVVYDGGNNQRYGNITAFLKSGDRFVTEFLKYPPGKIKFLSGKGKAFFHEQFWLIPKGASAPEIERGDFANIRIGDRFHFSNACLVCEPSYPWLTRNQPNFEEYASILKAHDDYIGEIDVFNFTDLTTVKRRLTNDLKLPRNRYRIRMLKSESSEDLSVDLYLLPKTLLNKSAKTAKLKTDVSD